MTFFRCDGCAVTLGVADGYCLERCRCGSFQFTLITFTRPLFTRDDAVFLKELHIRCEQDEVYA
jgi:hypothetical protein